MRDERNIDDYTLLHYQESEYGSGRAVGIKIFVRESSRDLVEADRNEARRAGDALLRALDVNTAKFDQTAPARRALLRSQFVSLYERIGERTIFVEEVPNGYSDDPTTINSPWFRITSRIGHVTIGWRRHVINIDWSDTVVEADGEDLFPDENVTKGQGYEGNSQYIHAYGYENAERYLRKLHEVQT